MRMPKKTRSCMTDYAVNLPPSAARAQCYTIANYVLNEGQTIASKLAQDHLGDGSLRAAVLMVSAGCAKEDKTNAKANCYGTFIFEDESNLN